MDSTDISLADTDDVRMENNKIDNNFYEKYHSQIRAVVARILRSANQISDVDDCVSIVFLELMEKLQQYSETRGSMGAFVTVISRSAALNYIKSNSRKNIELIGDEKLDFLAFPIEYQNEVEYNLLVESIIAKLNKDESLLFTMRYLYSYTPEEIARVLNIKRSAVDMRTNRLKTKIKNFLVKGGIHI